MAGPHSSVVQLASELCKEWSSYDSAHSFLLKFLFPKLSVKELDDADMLWLRDILKSYQMHSERYMQEITLKSMLAFKCLLVKPVPAVLEV